MSQLHLQYGNATTVQRCVELQRSAWFSPFRNRAEPNERRANETLHYVYRYKDGLQFFGDDLLLRCPLTLAHGDGCLTLSYYANDWVVSNNQLWHPFSQLESTFALKFASTSNVGLASGLAFFKYLSPPATSATIQPPTATDTTFQLSTLLAVIESTNSVHGLW